MSGHPRTLVVEARAKVNPFLRVLGRRPDGYHELETLILPISLSDRLEIHAHADPAEFRTLSLSLSVEGRDEVVRGVPLDESNLVLRAARELAVESGVRGFADVLLDKRVPAAAGLGGGSADAAATLRALNELWGCRLSEPRLRAVGARVGSDVPALLAGGPVVARGRGERVDRVEVAPTVWVLLTFDFPVRTADAFRWWDEDAGPTGPDPAPLLEAARGDRAGFGSLLFNDLEGPVMARHPEVREAKERLLAAGALGAVMCGSGPTVAGLVPVGRSVSVEGGIEVGSGQGSGPASTHRPGR